MFTRFGIFAAIVLAVLCVAVPAYSDWDPSQPAKWVQMPDESIYGLDVFNTYRQITGAAPVGKILADDFLCTTTERITDIHIWGSWLNDRLPVDPLTGAANPANVAFKLSIHADIPKSQTGEYSRPGPALWETVIAPGAVKVRPWGEPLTEGEGFFNPNTGQWVRAADKQIWQYNFFIDPAVAFLQKGTADNPVVYWLDVLAFPQDPEATFGWKTSIRHWNDDAVWGDVPQFGPNVPVDSWRELRYPDGHPYWPESIDLSFVITPEPGSIGLLALGSLALLRRRR